MANVRTQNRNRMQARAEASGKKRGVPKAKVPMVRPSTDIEGPRGGRGLSSLGEPSSNPLARQGSRAVNILNDAIENGPRIRDIGSGSSSQLKGRQLELPSAKSIMEDAQTKARTAGRNIVGAGLSMIPDISREARNADKPQNYPGEGLKPRAAFPQGSPESSIPAPKKAAPKPIARKPRGSSEDDAFMEDLRASAARMKADTAEAARATGRMKGAMEEFQSATDDATEGYKKGGRVGGRGDGKAIRGRTKGRFI
jgi:hypothetical protein